MIYMGLENMHLSSNSDERIRDLSQIFRTP